MKCNIHVVDGRGRSISSERPLRTADNSTRWRLVNAVVVVDIDTIDANLKETIEEDIISKTSCIPAKVRVLILRHVHAKLAKSKETFSSFSWLAIKRPITAQLHLGTLTKCLPASSSARWPFP